MYNHELLIIHKIDRMRRSPCLLCYYHFDEGAKSLNSIECWWPCESLRNPCPTQGRNSSSTHNRGGTWLPPHERRVKKATIKQTRKRTLSLSSFISCRWDESRPSFASTKHAFYDNIDISFIASAFLSRSSMLCYLWRVPPPDPRTISKKKKPILVRDEFTNKSFSSILSYEPLR